MAYQNGEVTHEVRTIMRMKNFTEKIVFDVTNTGSSQVIIGTPFLDRFAPEWRSTLTQFASRDARIHNRNDMTLSYLQEEGDEEQNEASLHEDTFIFRMYKKVKELFSMASAGTSTPVLPQEYKQYERVFKEDAENELPKHAPWDHEIKLLPGKEPKGTKLYGMSPAHREECKKYVDKLLIKGFIRTSEAPAAYSLFFVPKKGGKLRPVIDYRLLNEITKKDGYPLPLIGDMLDRLRGAKYFTKMDLRGAYNLIRVKDGDEWKTAFKTTFGMYEYLVMPFGLTNAPATFQKHINNVLRANLDIFVLAYMDDIIVFSSTMGEHTEHVKWVLQQLDKHDLRVELDKCEFHVQETDFLGYVIRRNEIGMSSEKVKAITEWPTPKTVREIQSFLGFGNFYRRFIKGYSGVAKALTELTRKDTPFEWKEPQERAFQKMKDLFTTAPVLTTFDYEKAITIETDASDYAIGACLNQPDESGKLHPVAFYSRTMSSPELNYDIHDKELLAIVEALKHWKVYCTMPKHQVHVITDHKNLTYFTSTKVLNRRQTRWAEELANFDYRISYQKGSENSRADALSRRADYIENKKQVSHAIFQAQEDGTLLHNQQSLSSMFIVEETPRAAQIKAGYANDKIVQLVEQDNSPFKKDNNGFVTLNNRVYVPTVEQNKIIQDTHNDGHRGIGSTMERVQRTFYIPELKRKTENIVNDCDTCKRSKHERHRPYGLLQPLQPPDGAWHSIAMDFITDLPVSKEPGNTTPYDTIFVVTDRLTKYAYFLPTVRSCTAQDLSFVLHKHIVSQHGAPKEIISDRDKLFTSKFWKSLMALMGVKHKASTAFHPQTDGQTERLNQTLEQFLRAYINYKQDNWTTLLPLAQFVYNNNANQTTKETPFFANYGRHPTLEHDAHELQVYSDLAQLQHSEITALHEQLKQELLLAAARSSLQANKHRSCGPDFKEGDSVYLRRKNIKTQRPSNKLDHTKLGPFKISKALGPVTFRLELPATMRIHPVFHKSLLEPAAPNAEPPGPVLLDETTQNEEYEIERILDHRQHRGRKQYLVKWKGYTDAENTWEPIKNLRNSPEALRQYQRNPNQQTEAIHPAPFRNSE